MTPSQKALRAKATPPGVRDERHALLQRILWSHQFEKSTRLRELLVYVCERASQDPGAEIHEQEIGHRVFGRPDDYDTARDNIVRVTASQVRKKLEQHFLTEGIAEPLILEIPKGHYTPVFRPRTFAAVEVVEPLQGAPPKGRAIAILSIAVCLLAILAGSLALRVRTLQMASRSPLESNPNLNALWSQLLATSGRTDIVASDSSLSLFQELLDSPMTLAEYLKQGWWTRAQLSGNPQLQGFAQQAAQRRFTSLANVTFAYRAARLTGAGQTLISVFSARDFNIRQMKFDNVILLGSVRANPWAELISGSLNFQYGFDQKSRYSYFENRHPNAGEQKLYSTDSSVSYCHLAFVPNLGRTGNILAIAGTEVEGTEGGGEFLTNERSVAQVRVLTKPGRDGKLPYFEVLLKSSRVGGATPGFSIVAFRQLPS